MRVPGAIVMLDKSRCAEHPIELLSKAGRLQSVPQVRLFVNAGPHTAASDRKQPLARSRALRRNSTDAEKRLWAIPEYPKSRRLEIPSAGGNRLIHRRFLLHRSAANCSSSMEDSMLTPGSFTTMHEPGSSKLAVSAFSDSGMEKCCRRLRASFKRSVGCSALREKSSITMAPNGYPHLLPVSREITGEGLESIRRLNRRDSEYRK